MQRILTDSDLSVLTTALDTACDKWRENAAVAREAKHPRIAAQFIRQCEEAGKLRDLLEMAEHVKLEGI